MDVLREYIKNESLTEAIQRSPYFIEIIDAFYLYDKYVEQISSEELNKIENLIYKQTGGFSLDYYLFREF